MAAKGKKADYHLRLVQIKLRKNVCKSLWTKCASISNYLIHVMLSYLLASVLPVLASFPGRFCVGGKNGLVHTTVGACASFPRFLGIWILPAYYPFFLIVIPRFTSAFHISGKTILWIMVFNARVVSEALCVIIRRWSRSRRRPLETTSCFRSFSTILSRYSCVSLAIALSFS